MHRFFVSPEKISDDTVTLTGPDVNHIRTVLRMKPGDTFGVMDGAGFLYEVELQEVSRDVVQCAILSKTEMTSESPLNIYMGQALLKGSALDSAVRKATELGVGRILPLSTERCVSKLANEAQAGRTERWQRIAEEAAKQCCRSQVPTVHSSVLSLTEFCKETADCDLKLVFWEEETATRLKDIVSSGSVASIAFVAGPEGGLTKTEIILLRERGFQTVTLGPRILKADSASAVILSLLQHRWGDM